MTNTTYIYLIIVSSLLYSCGNHEKDYEQISITINRSFDQINYSAEKSMNSIAKENANNPLKVEPFSNRAKTVNNAANKLFDKANLLIQNKNITQDAVSEIVEEYVSIIDSIKWNHRLWETVHFKSSKVLDEYGPSPHLSLLAIKNEVAINQCKILELLLSAISGNDDWYLLPEIYTMEVHSDSSYIFSLHSQGIQQIKNKVIKIDTVLLNGKLYDTQINTNSSYNFGQVQLNASSKGNYIVKGTVILTSDYGTKIEERFNHNFTIK